MRPLYHRGGPFPCGRVALFVRQYGTRYETPADNVVLTNGKRPRRGDPMLCGACGNPIVTQWLFPTLEPKIIIAAALAV